jgi:Bacterial archaeo-eukaryotic release factor family 3
MLDARLRLLHELACWRHGPCVTVYLSLDPSHPDQEADRVEAKNLIRDARRQLEATTGDNRSTVEQLLAPARDLMDRARLQEGSHGVGVFSAPGFAKHVPLTAAVPPLSVVANSFVVTPLLAGSPTDDSFYLLAVSQNRVRLFRGQHHSLVDVAVPGLPQSRSEALWYEQHERQLNIHGGSHQGADRIEGTFHGSSAEADLRKQQLARFFQIVDHALWNLLHDTTTPLFVAGIGYELAMYKQANRYPHLTDTIDIGDPTRLKPTELQALVWPTVAAALDAPRRAIVAQVRSSESRLTSIPAILAACRDGRVAVLLVQPARLVWGPPDGTTTQSERGPGDVELLSVTIGAALDQGATVHVAASDELPDGSPVAALARY